jgi:hypothetical protein
MKAMWRLLGMLSVLGPFSLMTATAAAASFFSLARIFSIVLAEKAEHAVQTAAAVSISRSGGKENRIFV